MTLDELDSARNVIIRATDAMNNVATAVADISDSRRAIRAASP